MNIHVKRLAVGFSFFGFMTMLCGSLFLLTATSVPAWMSLAAKIFLLVVAFAVFTVIAYGLGSELVGMKLAVGQEQVDEQD